MIEEIDPGDHHTREMYARYGLAMYFAQVVEAAIKNALLMARLSDDQFATVDDFDAAFATNFKTVLGRLVERFKPFLAHDELLGEDLQLALAARNQLAHHFFWDHAADSMSWDGRERMMRECDAASELFQEISARLEVVVRMYSKAGGTPMTVFEDRLAQAREDLLAGTEAGDVGNCGRCLTPMNPAGTPARPYCHSCGTVAVV